VAVQTFGNGRTYAIIPNSNFTNGAELAELPASGPLRFSGQILSPSGPITGAFDHAGNLTNWSYDTQNGAPAQSAYVQALTGYDENGWPLWSGRELLAYVPDTLNSPPWGVNATSNDPVGFGGWGMSFNPQSTSGGVFPTYNTYIATPGLDHHLGGVLAGATNWFWKASPGALITTPDGQGTFTDINSYGSHDGIAALAEGSYILQGYDGQGAPFSSQWMQWSEDGLLIGQFGHPAQHPYSGELYPGAAANIATMATVSADNSIYLYNSDEEYHPGVHRWKISSLDSIHEVSGTTQLGNTVTLQ
jgi:hypothetical protein